MSQTSQIEERALLMLGSGTPASIVASALGVTESRISQMLSEPVFAEQVQELRFKNLQKQTLLDEKYASLEESLLTKLEKVLPIMTKPRDVLSAISVINGAKRRGAQVSQDATTSQKVINLTLPVHIMHKFVSNVNNQVIEVQDGQGDARSLVTASSRSLEQFAAEHLDQGKGEVHEHPTNSPEGLPRPQDALPAPEGLGQSSESSSGSAGTSGLAEFL